MKRIDLGLRDVFYHLRLNMLRNNLSYVFFNDSLSYTTDLEDQTYYVNIKKNKKSKTLIDNQI